MPAFLHIKNMLRTHTHTRTHQWRAYHRPGNSGPGTIYTLCRRKSESGTEQDRFDTAEEAALAYDEVVLKKEKEGTYLNFYSETAKCVGLHMKEDNYGLM